MKLRSLVSLAAVVGVVLVACGGGSDLSPLCSQKQECAEKAGNEFSKTECETDAKEQAEKADTAGCGDEFGDYASCANDLDFECSDDFDKKILSECGKQSKDYDECID